MFGFGKKVRYASYPGLSDKSWHEADVVGESNYQDALRKMSASSTDDQHLWVALRREPNNAHDRNAVRVDWIVGDGSGWHTVGYIPRDEALDWHPIISSAPKGTVWVWPAYLLGGSGSKSLGVVVRHNCKF